MEFPSKEDFEKWLRSKKPKEIVAKDWSFCDCPLSNFVLSTGVSSVYVEPEGGGVGTATFRGEHLDLPDWANKFADTIDLYNEETGVTAEFCLKVLLTPPSGEIVEGVAE